MSIFLQWASSQESRRGSTASNRLLAGCVSMIYPCIIIVSMNMFSESNMFSDSIDGVVIR